ncbi:40S ribosomal S27-2 [Olea europaea subsp. europaea]|uniref:40S ribosomal S27-2 n=1 Tax=Olea europaea subsp. europaea TaxID=158383 RepID=A0A8S0P6T0_OLEEU|nr:40S ribosomal S27-2 [Olea europaea subsp. europaea]
MVLPNDVDLLNPPAELEKRKHKLKRLVQSPNSFFMNHRVQPLANGGGVWELPDRAVSANWWSCPAYRRLLIQEKG